MGLHFLYIMKLSVSCFRANPGQKFYLATLQIYNTFFNEILFTMVILNNILLGKY